MQNYNFACFVYGCETWSLTLREELRLKVSESRVLRRIFGPWIHDVTEELRKVSNEELSDLYSSPNTIRVIKSSRLCWDGHVSSVRERINAYKILVGKPEGKLGKPRRRWEDIIKIYLQEVRWGAWTGLIWPRVGRGGLLL
jgi:hypothetical protein